MRFIFLFIFLFDSAFALTWQEGLKIVSENNPEILAAKNSLQSSLYKEKAARSGFLPKVSASAGTTLQKDSVDTKTIGVTATENLFSGFSDMATFEQARLNRELTDVNLVSVKAKVSYDYKTGFMNLLFAEKYIKLVSDIIKRREANLKLVQLRFESGRENIGSLHLSKAYLAQAKYDSLIATNSLSVSQAELAKVLGSEQFVGLEVSGEVPLIVTEITDLKKLTFNTPDYKKADFDEKISLTSIDLQKSNFYPSLNLSQNINKSNRNSGPWNQTWSIGAELTLPLFSGGKDYYSYKSASELYRAAVLGKKNIQDSVTIKLKDTYNKYIEAIAKLEVDQAFLEASSSRERIAKEKYNNGLLTFDEWDIIENDLIGRQKALVQSERDRVIAEAYWEQVQGKGVL